MQEQIKAKLQQLEGINFEIEEQKKELKKYEIRAVCDGNIDSLEISEGKIVQEGERICSIWNPEEFILKTKISELEIDRIKQGQKVLLQFKIPGRISQTKSIQGVVEKIGAKPIEEALESNLSFYPVEIKFSSTEVRRGMHLSADIKILLKKDALCLPIEAVREENNKFYVWVKDDSQQTSQEKNENGKVVDEYGTKESYYKGANKRQVTIGVSNKDYVEILQGLKEGEMVLLPQAYAKVAEEGGSKQ